MDWKSNFDILKIQKYEEYAKSKNGTLVKLELTTPGNRPRAYYICHKGHEFNNVQGYSSWCPVCGMEARKKNLVERNKSNRTYSLLPTDINEAVKKFGAEYMQMDYTPKSILEKVKFRLFDGSVKEVAICHAFNGHLGKRKLKSVNFQKQVQNKAEDFCKDAGYIFTSIKLGPNNSFSKATVKYLNKQGKPRECQGAWLSKRRYKEKAIISKPAREIESFLISLGIVPVMEHRISLNEDDFKGFDKYYELKLQERVKQVEVAKHKRYMSVDVFIPSHNIAIEYHGARWHDSLRSPSKRYECSYKRKCCESRGIHLIQIYQHEWADRKEQMKSILRNKLGRTPKKLNGRDCTISEIPKEQAYSFIDKYHLQGKPSSIRAAYGMFHEGELVAAVSLKKEGLQPGKELYLDRLVIHPDYSIRGSLGKFNKYLKTKHDFLYTLIDLRLHNPNNWVKSGWSLDAIMPSSYSYFDEKTRKHYDKRKFRKVPEIEKEDENDSKEDAYVKSLGTFCKLWNCGRARLSLTNIA